MVAGCRVICPVHPPKYPTTVGRTLLCERRAERNARSKVITSLSRFGEVPLVLRNIAHEPSHSFFGDHKGIMLHFSCDDTLRFLSVERLKFLVQVSAWHAR